MREIVKPGTQNKIRLISPDSCPHCHKKCTPKHFNGYYSKNERDLNCYYDILICPNLECQKYFATEYVLGGPLLTPARFLNGTVMMPEWPEAIRVLESTFDESVGDTSEKENPKSKFIDTYRQALEAENHGLDEIAGMGFRKSIEYLVKDVAARDFPEDKDKIKKLFLGDVVKKYYSGDLKDLLERATWLGNDQSHYFKLFEEYDITTLKELIGLIVSELDTAYRKKKYIEAIQGRK